MKRSELLECPVCFETPLAEVYQCKNGHSICSICISKIRECPQCRASYSQGCIRNRALEALLDSKKIGCPNKSLGCKERLARKSLQNHLLNCAFDPQSFPVCRLVHLNCNFIANPRDLASTVNHLVKSHYFRFLSFKKINFQIDLVCFQETIKMFQTDRKMNHGGDCLGNREHIWNPVVISRKVGLESSEEVKETFLLFCKTFPVTQDGYMMSWHCYQLSAKDDGSPYEAEFSIKSKKSGSNGYLHWKAPVLSLQQLNTGNFSDPLKIDVMSLLKDYMISERQMDDILTAQVSIKRQRRLTPPMQTEDVAPLRIRPLISNIIEDKVTPNEGLSKNGISSSARIVVSLAACVLIVQFWFWMFSESVVKSQCSQCPQCPVCPEEEITVTKCLMTTIQGIASFASFIINYFTNTISAYSSRHPDNDVGYGSYFKQLI